MWFRSVAVALLLGAPLPSAHSPARSIPMAVPPQAAATGPSLVDTMKYIEDKLNSIGPVSYTAYPNDGSEPVSINGSTLKFRYAADASACSITQYRELDNTSVSTVIPLHTVSKIDVASVSAFDTSGSQFRFQPDPPELRLTSGTLSFESTTTHPDLSFKIDKKHPVAPTVSEKHTSKVWAVLFDDPDAADRTAKAFLHAVELCGGGQKKELF